MDVLHGIMSLEIITVNLNRKRKKKKKKFVIQYHILLVYKKKTYCVVNGR